ncbi:MAG: 30S ribosomal protein S20 [Candidatus Wildermuthbacteria bacterium]|nr:30S ribosomal protein S20 [Candidatus Wildermuthbacteria bacterium]
MPITKSAKKALRQSIRRRAQNLKVKNTLKALVKRVRMLALQKNSGEARAILPALFKALDKAAKLNVIAKNTASRHKSRLTKLISKIL